MLWGVDPLLTADLLYALRRMGHGDEIVVVDTNFPAASTAMSTVIGEPIPLAGVNAARAVEAILSVMPLDTFVPDPACRMEIVGDPDACRRYSARCSRPSIARRASTCRCRGSSASLSTSVPRALSPLSRPASGAFTAASSSRRASSRLSECAALTGLPRRETLGRRRRLIVGPPTDQISAKA